MRASKRFAAGAALERIGVGQQRAFARNVPDLAFEDLVLAQALDDLLARQAFRNRDPMLDGAAAHERFAHLPQRRLLLEFVLAGPKRLPGGKHGKRHLIGLEGGGAADHAVLLEDLRDL